MERRLVLFAVTAFAVILGYNLFIAWLFPHKPPPPQAAAAHNEQPKPAAKPQQAEKPAPEKPRAAPEIKAAPEPEVPEQWVTLGSADENDPYRMLVTLTNRGAAVARIELSSPRYCDIDNRSGYLGHLVMNEGKLRRGLPGTAGRSGHTRRRGRIEARRPDQGRGRQAS